MEGIEIKWQQVKHPKVILDSKLICKALMEESLQKTKIVLMAGGSFTGKDVGL